MLWVLHVKFLLLKFFAVIAVVSWGARTIAAVTKYPLDLIPRTNPVCREPSVGKEPGGFTLRQFLTAQVYFPEPFSYSAQQSAISSELQADERLSTACGLLMRHTA